MLISPIQLCIMVHFDLISLTVFLLYNIPKVKKKYYFRKLTSKLSLTRQSNTEVRITGQTKVAYIHFIQKYILSWSKICQKFLLLENTTKILIHVITLGANMFEPLNLQRVFELNTLLYMAQRSLPKGCQLGLPHVPNSITDRIGICSQCSGPLEVISYFTGNNFLNQLFYLTSIYH